jgi:hypothetical protein
MRPVRRGDCTAVRTPKVELGTARVGSLNGDTVGVLSVVDILRRSQRLMVHNQVWLAADGVRRCVTGTSSSSASSRWPARSGAPRRGGVGLAACSPVSGQRGAGCCADLVARARGCESWGRSRRARLAVALLCRAERLSAALASSRRGDFDFKPGWVCWRVFASQLWRAVCTHPKWIRNPRTRVPPSSDRIVSPHPRQSGCPAGSSRLRSSGLPASGGTRREVARSSDRPPARSP